MSKDKQQQSKQPRQPRVTTPGQDRELQPEVYRAGMYAERQKFGPIKKQLRQLALTEQVPQRQIDEWVIKGLDLTIEQDKALSAIQAMLSRTDYQGNIPGLYQSSSDYKWKGLIPRLAFTPVEYLETYGLKPSPSGQYPVRQRKKAFEALEALAETRRLIYKRTKYVKGQKRYDLIVVHKPLISLIEGYENLTEAEVSAVETGKQGQERATRLVIEIGPLLLDSVDKFYLLKPTTLHQEIEDLLAEKRGKRARIPRAISLFVQWLLTKNWYEVKVSRENLVDILRLEKYREQRKIKTAYDQIDESLETAEELGYLLSYTEDVFGVLTLELNPMKCSRVVVPEEQQEDLEDDTDD